MALRLDAQADTLQRTANLPSATSFTVCGWFRRRGTGGTNQLLVGLGEVGSHVVGCYIGIGATYEFNVYSSMAGAPVSSGVAVTADQWYFVAVSNAGTGATDAKVRHAAPGASSLTTASAAGSTFTSNIFTFGLDDAGQWSNVSLAGWKLYDRVLTDAELLAEMNWLRPASTTNLNAWWPMVADVAATADNDYSGNARDLTAGGTLTIEDGPPVGWGASPIWIVDHPAGGAGDVTVSVPSTSLTLSANAPTVVTTANKVVDVPKGTLSLTSFVPSVAVSDHKLVNVPQGSLLLFGLAPTVAATAHVTVSVPADALSLSTFVPTVTATGNVLISVPLATLSLAATAPLVLTGASQIVQVPKGTLTLAAEAPTVATTANQVVSVPKADLTLTSYEPSVVATANQKVDVPAASLELTGYAPTVSADGGTIVSVPFSSLELTLHAPTIVTPRVVSIPEAVLELVAYEPTIITPRLIDVPSTSLTLTSFAPEVHTTAVIEVPATSLTITGYAPSVDAGSGGGVASTRVTWG